MNKELIHFVKKCVDNYAIYDSLDKFYYLTIQDLPDFVQHEFAAQIIADDTSWAAEAASQENPEWETKMLPALTRYLKNSSDKDESIEFNNVWRDCVTSYLTTKMQELIDDTLNDFNNDHVYIHEPGYYYGVSSYSTI